MRLAYLSTDPWPQAMPGSVFSTRTAQALADLGIETHLIVADNPFPPEAEVLDPVRPPLEVHRVRPWRPFPWSARSRLGLHRRMAALVGQLERQRGLEAVIARNLKMAALLARRRTALGVPLIYEAHNLYLPEFSSNRRLSRLEARTLPALDGLIGVTRTLVEKAVIAYQPNGPVLAAGSALELTEEVGPPLRDRPLKAAYVGTLNPHKGLGGLMEAIAKMQQPMALKVLGGDPGHPLMRGLQERARTLGIEGRVEWTGWVPIRKIASMLTDCRLGLVPLEETPYNRFLTSPMKVFDYRAAGLPVLASDLPAVRECFEDPERQAFWLPSGGASGWAERMDRLIGDADRLEEARRTLLQTGAERTWRRRAERLIGLVQSVRG